MSKNKVFFVYDVEEKYGYNIACENKEKALEIFKDNNLLDCKDFDRELAVELNRDHYPNGEWSEKGQTFETDHYGVLDVKQEFEIGIAWFQCDDCSDDSFEFDKDLRGYVCTECGHADRIPYVD